MKKDIKDYLHLYLGCEVMDLYNDRVAVMNGILTMNEGIKVCVFYKTTWQLSVEEVKLILRPLSDMTEDEADIIWELTGWYDGINGCVRIGEIIKEFFVLEDNEGEPRNSSWLYLMKALPYILSRGFDLFGLIQEGLAIDKTKLKL